MRHLYEDENWMKEISRLVSEFNELENQKQDQDEWVFQFRRKFIFGKTVPDERHAQLCLLQQNMIEKFQDRIPDIMEQINLLGQKYEENPFADTKPFIVLQNALRILIKEIDTTDSSVDLRPMFDTSIQIQENRIIFYLKNLVLNSREVLSSKQYDGSTRILGRLDCPNLERLKIIAPENPTMDEFQLSLRTFRCAKNLRVLDASDNNWDIMDMVQFVQPASSGSVSVEILNLQNNKIKSVPELFSCPNLEVLNLNYNNGDDSEVPEDAKQCLTDVISVLEDKENLPKLRELRIVGLNLDRSTDQMWNLPQKLKLIEMDTKWLNCIPQNRIKSTAYSSDGKSVTVYLK